MSPRVASVAPLAPRIRTDGGRLGISSDWIGGRWMPIQTTTPIAGDEGPQRQHHAPIDQPADAGAAFASARRRGVVFGRERGSSLRRRLAALPCRRWPAGAVLRAQTQIEACGVGRHACGLPLSPRHIPSPSALIPKSGHPFSEKIMRTEADGNQRGLRGGYRSAGPGGSPIPRRAPAPAWSRRWQPRTARSADA